MKKLWFLPLIVTLLNNACSQETETDNGPSGYDYLPIGVTYDSVNRILITKYNTVRYIKSPVGDVRFSNKAPKSILNIVNNHSIRYFIENDDLQLKYCMTEDLFAIEPVISIIPHKTGVKSNGHSLHYGTFTSTTMYESGIATPLKIFSTTIPYKQYEIISQKLNEAYGEPEIVSFKYFDGQNDKWSKDLVRTLKWKNKEVEILLNFSGYIGSIDYDESCKCYVESSMGHEEDDVIDNLTLTYQLYQDNPINNVSPYANKSKVNKSEGWPKRLLIVLASLAGFAVILWAVIYIKNIGRNKKICPYCKEKINLSAILCKHCGSTLE